MKVEVIGVISGESKNKNGELKPSTTIFYKTPFSDYDSNREGMICDGKKVGQCYIGKIINCFAGDIVSLDFVPGYEGKATLDDVTVIQSRTAANVKEENKK